MEEPKEKRYAEDGCLIVSELGQCAYFEKDATVTSSCCCNDCFFCKFSDFRKREYIERVESEARKSSAFLVFGEAIPDSIYDYVTLYPEYALLGFSIYVDGEYQPIDALPTTMGKDEIDIRVELEAIGPDVTVIHKVMNVDGETYSEIVKTFVAMPFEELDLSAHVLTTLGAGFTYRIPVCGNDMPCTEHIDENEDAICDNCGMETLCDDFEDTHRDDNHDHRCDNCGIRIGIYCIDFNEDGRCDDCYAPAYCDDNYKLHVDGDDDHYCDECGVWISYVCVDEDEDWECDLCFNELTCVDHIDEDENALCDICIEETKCKHNPSDTYHEDYDCDHICDYCEVWMSLYCIDDNYDGYCDEPNCNREFVCEHFDEDDDNYCDICYRIINCTHESVFAHVCEICYQTVSECYDEDRDLFCDECYESVECDHDGMEGEHVCRYCYDYLTDCFDEDGDGECDLSEYFPHSISDRN